MNAWQWAGLGLGIVQAIAWPVVVGVAVWLLQPLLKSLRRGGTLELEAAGVRATIRAVEQGGYATYAFEGWLSFMLNNGLVERTGDTLRSTVFGNDFLIYLREQRLTENKLG
jgi:hypothetical protein